jgi:group I intron endonuclease
MIATIYKIINDINNKIYVGQTWKTAKKRFKRHCAEARWKNTKNMPIILAIKKYGQEHFKVKILEKLKNPTQKEVDDREIYWVNHLNTFSPNGYNLKAGQGNGIFSQETKDKISKSNTGKKATSETIEKLRISHLGYKVKESTKRKLSEINKGKILSEEHKNKITQSLMGHKCTVESKNKMRDKKLKYEYELLSPNNIIFKTNNLRIFSIEHNLNVGHMNSVANGRIKHHKNWTLISRKELKS